MLPIFPRALLLPLPRLLLSFPAHALRGGDAERALASEAEGVWTPGAIAAPSTAAARRSPSPTSLRAAGEERSRRWRRKIVAHILAVVASLFLAAWAPKAPYVHIRSIGVIAALGDTCMFEHVTDKPFQWIGPPEASFLEISDWNIDDDVTKAIGAALAPRYSVQSIPIEHQDFDTWTHESLTRHIRELPVPETRVDAYLLVLRDWQADAIGGSDHQLAGLGLYRRDLPRRGRRVAVYASYRLVLMEPEHGGIIASPNALLPDGRLPSLPVSSSLWPRTQNDLTDRQHQALHAAFMALIGRSLPGTLRQLALATK